MKWIIAALAAALLVILGFIFVINFMPAQPAAPAPVQTAAQQAAPAPTDAPAAAAVPEEQAPEADAPESAGAESFDEDIYEGALAGLSEDEMGALAMAEEGAHLTEDDLEGGVD